MQLDHFNPSLESQNFDDQELSNRDPFSYWKNLGNDLVRNGHLDQAEDAYLKAFQLNPESGQILVNLGSLEIQRSCYTEAIHYFQMAIHRDQHDEKAWLGLALCYRAGQDNDLAWANLEQSLDMNPFFVTGLHLALQWSIEDRCWSRPLRYLKPYVIQNPTDTQMAQGLISLLLQCRRWAEAKIMLGLLKVFDSSNEQIQLLEKYLVENTEIRI